MSTNPTPPLTHRAKVLNDGTIGFAEWLAGELPYIDGNEELLFEQVKKAMNLLSNHAHEAKAKDVHQCESLIVCPYCRGQGGVGYEAGDHSGWDDCETCSATGFLPASFEPRPIYSDLLRDETRCFGSDLPLKEERPDEAK